MNKSISDRVISVIIDQLGVRPERVTTHAAFFEDLACDSLDLVELVIAYENEFGLEIPDEDAELFLRVSDVISYVVRQST